MRIEDCGLRIDVAIGVRRAAREPRAQSTIGNPPINPHSAIDNQSAILTPQSAMRGPQ
jgi:hypothetical protein